MSEGNKETWVLMKDGVRIGTETFESKSEAEGQIDSLTESQGPGIEAKQLLTE